MSVRLIPLCLLTGLASVASAQESSIVGRILARGTGEPMAYAVVGLPSLNIERFATDSGLFYFGNLPAGTLVLRVRRLGYMPVDTIVNVGGDQRDTIRIQLTRVAMSLASITVSAHPPCKTPGLPTDAKDSTLATILHQVRMNADQYSLLVKRYPFVYTNEVMRSSRLKKGGETRIDAHHLERKEALIESKYVPGQVLVYRSGMTWFQLPHLVDFADADFLGNHCFHLRGTERVEDEVLIRVDLVAADKLREPDVNGSIYLEPGSFQVRRMVLGLSKISRDINYLQDFEITTVFREIMPSIPVMASMESAQKMSPKSRSPIDVAWQTFKLASYEFTRGKPGEDVKKTP